MPAAFLRLLARLPIDARRVDEAECVLSVLLAILLAHRLGATNVSWAAFSGYMVMRGHVADTLTRGVLRIVGTLSGGVLALAAAPLALASPVACAAAVGLIGTASLYGALAGRHAYAWLFFGLTFVMVVLDAAARPALPLAAFVETRIVEVIAGTLACVLVSLVSTVTLRRRWPATRVSPAQRLGWHVDAFRHAAQAGIALAALAFLGTIVAIPALSAGAITIMAVMIVPAAGLGSSALSPVTRRLLHRFFGCSAGALLSAAVLFLAQGAPGVLVAATAFGVAAGRHLENGQSRFAYAGTQFVLAVLIVLVPDSYADAALAPGLDRLVGVLIGMALLEPVLIAWHVVAPRRRKVSEAPNELGGI